MVNAEHRSLAPLLILPLIFLGLLLHLVPAPDPPSPTWRDFSGVLADRGDDLIRLLEVEKRQPIDGYLGHLDMPVSLMDHPGAEELQRQLKARKVKGMVARASADCVYFVLYSRPYFRTTHYRGIAHCPSPPTALLVSDLEPQWDLFRKRAGARYEAGDYAPGSMLALQKLEGFWYAFTAVTDHNNLLQSGRF